MLAMFKEFLDDPEQNDMYVKGAAGTGKTWGLAEVVKHCVEHELEYTVCAYTHKACGVIRYALPLNANISTLHSFLKKRPTINDEATKAQHVEVSRQHGKAKKTNILIIDEYSIVGERDVMSIREIEPPPKILWLGDEHQLPPVDDMQSVSPYGPYQLTLTKRWRTGDDSPLQVPLDQLISFIEGAPPEPLVDNSCFIRGRDLLLAYKRDPSIVLAFTNRAVQDWNSRIEGKTQPEPGDLLFCPTTRLQYTMREVGHHPTEIKQAFGTSTLQLGSKYRTLEHLIDSGYSFMDVEDSYGEHTVCYIFGHQAYNDKKTELKQAAAAANKAIEGNAREWSQQNPNAAKTRTRAKAWRDFLSFNENVVCLDFPHAMTVHKSQGSTYKTVYVDTQDIGIAAKMNYSLYLKLMYVAFSRASNKVVTN